jgi:hypothetical protein
MYKTGEEKKKPIQNETPYDDNQTCADGAVLDGRARRVRPGRGVLRAANNATARVGRRAAGLRLRATATGD